VGPAATCLGDRLAAGLRVEPAPGAGARSPGANAAAGAGHPAPRLPAGGRPCRPECRPLRDACSKWTPPYWRDNPACSAAERKLVHDRVIGLAATPRRVAVRGSSRELPAGMVTLSSKLPRPVKPVSTSAAAPLKVE
jgi:hypothetical protein